MLQLNHCAGHNGEEDMVEKVKLYFDNKTPGEMFSMSGDKQCG